MEELTGVAIKSNNVLNEAGVRTVSDLLDCGNSVDGIGPTIMTSKLLQENGALLVNKPANSIVDHKNSPIHMNHYIPNSGNALSKK